MTTLSRAVDRATAPCAERPIILADVADNRGGGGGANASAILRALVEPRVTNACVALVHDHELVSDAMVAGEKTSFCARFTARQSRGRFRAGFAHLVPPERIYGVDAPGLTTPDLGKPAWSRLTAAYPMMERSDWVPCAVDLSRRPREHA